MHTMNELTIHVHMTQKNRSESMMIVIIIDDNGSHDSDIE